MSQTPNQRFTSDEISGIAFKVKLIPLISPIWGGLWLAVTGIFLRMGTDYWPSRRRKDMTDHLEEKEARNVIHKRDKDESYYEDLLELELAEMDGSKARTGTVRRNGQSGVQKRPSTSRREKRRRV